jgi:hypothetical protein
LPVVIENVCFGSFTTEPLRAKNNLCPLLLQQATKLRSAILRSAKLRSTLGEGDDKILVEAVVDDVVEALTHMLRGPSPAAAYSQALKPRIACGRHLHEYVPPVE